MSFVNAPLSLLQRPPASPLGAALGGFTQGAGALQDLRAKNILNALRQAQAQTAQAGAAIAPELAQIPLQKLPAQLALLRAQAAQAQAKAQSPFGAQTLTGPAGQAFSDILFKQRFKDDPDAMKSLTDAHNAAERSANARWFLSIPSDERAQLFAKAKTLGFSQGQATKIFGQGGTLQDMANQSQVLQKPVSQSTTPPSDISGAHIATQDQLNKDIKDVQAQTKPINTNDIPENFAPTESAKTRAQQSAQASAGLDYLGKYISNNLNYGGITAKITRPWLQDAYSHDPDKQQKAVDYYVAQAIKPELSLLRIRIQGGQASARAIAAIEPTILGSIKVNLSNLPARIQRRVQTKATNILNESAYQTQIQTLAPNPNVFNPDSQKQAAQNISSTPTVAQPTQQTGAPSQEDLEFTAKKRGITVEEVKRRLGIK